MNFLLRTIHIFPNLFKLLPLWLLLASFINADAATSLVFAPASKLASGTWVKISVTDTGLYRITNAQLAQMGFSDPASVKVYGYGGNRLSELLSPSTVIDDLPQTPSVVDGGGIVFYGRGPLSWSASAGSSPIYTHSINPFSAKGYYFLSDGGDAERLAPAPSAADKPITAVGAATSFRERIAYHPEQAAFGSSGFTFLSDDMLATGSFARSFALPGIVAGNAVNKVWMRIGAGAANTAPTIFTPATSPSLAPASGSSTIYLRASDQSYLAGQTGFADFASSSFSADRLDVALTFSSSATPTIARLHFIDINYERELSLAGTGGALGFTLATPKGSLAGAGASTLVWDVTSPLSVEVANTAEIDGRLVWQNPLSGTRSYVAWNPGTTLPAPVVEGTVANQNLHGMGNPHMVIFTSAELAASAERYAAYRRGAPSNLEVAVVNIEDVFEEFSSGTPDVQAFRRLLKMLYERPESRLRHALFIGRPIWDYRRISARSSEGECNGPALPAWETLNSTDEFGQSYISYDPFAYLDDASQADLHNNYMRISVGVIPATDNQMVDDYLTKVKGYESNARMGSWRNKMILLSDGSTEGVSFMSQSDRIPDYMEYVAPGEKIPGVGAGMFPTKIYVEAYPRVNGIPVKAVEEFHSRLDEGVAWVSYIGHSSHTDWGATGLMNQKYANSMSLRRKPIIFAATCDYANLDGPEICGAEQMFRNIQGPPAVIASTRSVAVSQNGHMAYYVGESLGAAVDNIDYKGDEGTILTVGQVMQRAKNRILATSSTAYRSNATRFILVGDPALIQAVPAKGIRVSSMHNLTDDSGLDLGADVPPHIKGGSKVSVSGEITDTDGSLLDSFNGEIEVSLYDGLYDITTLGLQCDKRTVTLQGGKLTEAKAVVKDGIWEAVLNVPLEIANNNTAAALSMYAVDSSRTVDATGSEKGFTVSGFAEIDTDTQSPVIHRMWLNHDGFENGGTVDPNPTFYATISDNVAINISESGVGRGMTICLDGKRTFTDLPSHFTTDFGSCQSGTLAYPMSNLADGWHSLVLEVWDTSGNPASASVEFFVDSTVAPGILEVYTDTNPASVAANFYITHDRPDRDVTVGIEVFDLMGRKVWERTQKSYSEGNAAEPVTWDLTTGAGSRVSNGIYVYRATLSMPDGEKHTSKSRKLAVTSHP